MYTTRQSSRNSDLGRNVRDLGGWCAGSTFVSINRCCKIANCLEEISKRYAGEIWEVFALNLYLDCFTEEATCRFMLHWLENLFPYLYSLDEVCTTNAEAESNRFHLTP
jgi:hypothetical protein